jgi:zinc protease
MKTLWWKTYGVLLVAGLLAAANCPAATKDLRLENGLRVSLRPVSLAVDVAVVVLFDVGELHDPPGKSGLSHLVEHLYFTAATPTAASRTFGQFIQAYRKGWNAQTGDDYTVLTTVLAPDRLDDELKDAAARMSRLRIEQADLDREVPRMLEEIHNMFEGLAPLAARNHARERLHPRPHGGRHGGLPQQVKQLALSEVRRHWNDHYKAGNARVVIAGNINAAPLEAKVRQILGGIPQGRPAPAKPAPLPPTFGQTHVRLAGKSSDTLVCLAYRCPSPDSALFPAFLTLAAGLQDKAQKLGGGLEDFPVIFAPLDDFGTLYVISKTNQGETAEEAVKRWSRFVAEATEPTDVKQAVSTARQQFAFLLGTEELPDMLLSNNVYGVGFGLGRRNQLHIDGQRLAREMDRLERAAIQNGARQYLDENHRTIVIVEKQE